MKSRTRTLSVILTSQICALLGLQITEALADWTVQQAWVARYHQDSGGIDVARKIATDRFGNVYVTGNSARTMCLNHLLDLPCDAVLSNWDYVTVKYDSNGHLQWAAPYNNGGDVLAIVVDDSGNAYVTGNGGTLKYDANGAQLWVAPYPASAIAVDTAGNAYVANASGIVAYNAEGSRRWAAPGLGQTALAVDHDGDLYASGESWNADGTAVDSVTLKYHGPTGNQLWVTRYPSAYGPVSLALDGNGHVYVSGTAGTPGSTGDVLIVKYNGDDGSQIWAVRQPDEFITVASTVAADGTGNVCAGAVAYAPGYAHCDYVTVKYNANGVRVWEARSDASDGCTLPAMALDTQGNVYVTGSSWGPEGPSSATLKTVKYSASTGSELWVARKSCRQVAEYEKLVLTTPSLAVDNTGNVYVIGSLSASLFDYEAIKYDANGNEVWMAHYDGPGVALDIPAAIAVNDLGQVCLTGSAGHHYLTAKYDANGTLLWEAHYAGANNCEDGPVAIADDGAGNVYVTGWSDSGYATMKYDAQGQLVWAATLDTVDTGSLYHPTVPTVALAVDSARDAYVTGLCRNTRGGSDLLTVKYTGTTGSPLWMVRYIDVYGPAGVVYAGPSLALDGKGNVYVGATIAGPEEICDALTLKYAASNGDQLWAARYHDECLNVASALAVDSGGNVYATGFTAARDFWAHYDYHHGDYLTVKYDANGNQRWVARYDFYGEWDSASAVAVDAEGNAYVTGMSNAADGWGVATVKYDGETGKQIWDARKTGYDDSWHMGGPSLALDKVGSAYVTGTRGSDYETVKYDSNGKQVWEARFDGGFYEYAKAIKVDTTGNVYVTGASHGPSGYCRRGAITPLGILTVKYAQSQSTPLVMISSLDPDVLQAGGADSTLTVLGSGFVNGATVHWNGAARTTVFVSDAQLRATILGSDMGGGSQNVDTGKVTVINPDGQVSNPEVLTIVSANVGVAESQIAPVGQTASVVAPPGAPTEGGVAAAVDNSSGTEPVSVTTATLTANPESGTAFDVGSSYVDVRVSGASANTSSTVRFYYPAAVTGDAEMNLTLLYFTGTEWAAVRSSSGFAPAKDTRDNLDGTTSGGRITVILDGASTPKITELTGTEFALAISGMAPVIARPRDIVTGTGPGQCAAVVNYSVSASSSSGAVNVVCDPPSGSAFPKGVTTVKCTATDASGKTSSCTFTVTVNDTEPPAISCPANLVLPCSIARLVPVSYPAPTVTDNCDPAPTVTFSIRSGSGFPVGTTAVTANATDASGNASHCTFTVSRAPLGFTGFLPPIGGADATGGSLSDPLQTFKLKSTIPVKFTASCGGSAVITGIHTLQAIKWSNQTDSDPPVDATPTEVETTDNQFRLTGTEWHFNLDTKATGMTVGKWQLIATLSDGSQHSVWVQIK